MAENIRIQMRDGRYEPSSVLWLLAEELTVRQAALLLLNEDPEDWPYAESMGTEQSRPRDYLAARQVLASALLAGKVEGRVVPQTETIYTNAARDGREEPIIGSVQGDQSTIQMQSLKDWLASKNITVEQFVGLANTSEDFLDREAAAYSPKLAAAVSAWRHVKQNPESGLSVKRRLENWLRENGARYWPDGSSAKVSETFIKEAARIANWDAEGGRPSQFDAPTEKKSEPISISQTEVSERSMRRMDTSLETDFDDEIPF